MHFHAIYVPCSCDSHALPCYSHAFIDVLARPLPFADKPAALFLLVDGLRNASAAEWCAKRFHTHLLPRLSAFHSDPDDNEVVQVVKDALAHLEHALLDSPARYAGCSVALALLMGSRLVICTLGACRAVLCSPPEVAKKGPAKGWSCRQLEGATHLVGHNRLDMLSAQRRRRLEAYGPLDFELHKPLKASSPSESDLEGLSEAERAVKRALRAANPFAALGLSRNEAMGGGAGVGKTAVEAQSLYRSHEA